MPQHWYAPAAVATAPLCRWTGPTLLGTVCVHVETPLQATAASLSLAQGSTSTHQSLAASMLASELAFCA